MRMPALKLSPFWICAAVVVLVGVALTIFDVIAINKFIFFAGYVVLQYVVLATAWNIMGGYMGYVNFGTAGFFAVGAYEIPSFLQLIKRRRPVIPSRRGLRLARVAMDTGRALACLLRHATRHWPSFSRP